jgi:hypothetical protein
MDIPATATASTGPEWDVYQQTLQEAVQELGQRVSPGDVVVLHDPQTVP